MSEIAPLAADANTDSEDLRQLIAFVGYRPNALFTMAKRPGLLDAVLGLVRVTVRGDGQLSEGLRFLIAAETSRAAGCRYSAAHAAHAAAHAGEPEDKISALPAYQSSALYDAAERAALAFASVGGELPMRPAAAAFAAARIHFPEPALIEILGVISAFGWFNRWNSLNNSDLEAEPAAFAQRIGWLQPEQFMRRKA